MPSPTYVALAKNVLTSSQSSVSFSGISGDYTDLYIVVSPRNTGAVVSEFFYFTINNDSTGIYSYTSLQSTTSSVTSARSVSDPRFIIPYAYPGASATSNTFGSIEIYIPNYTAAQNRQVSITAVSETNSAVANNAYILCMAELYRNTTAITSIQFNSVSGSYASGSRFDLS